MTFSTLLWAATLCQVSAQPTDVRGPSGASADSQYVKYIIAFIIGMVFVVLIAHTTSTHIWWKNKGHWFLALVTALGPLRNSWHGHEAERPHGEVGASTGMSYKLGIPSHPQLYPERRRSRLVGQYAPTRHQQAAISHRRSRCH